MSTVELKYSLFKIIDAIQDNGKLRDIYSFISKKTDKDFWDTLSSEQKEDIEKALQDLDSGLGVTHEKLMAKYKNKYH